MRFAKHLIVLAAWSQPLFLMVSCSGSKTTVNLRSSNAQISNDKMALDVAAAISCSEPKVEVIQTIDWRKEVHGGNDWYNDFYTPLAYYNGNTYWVWRDEKYKVYISKIADNGHMDSYRLVGSDGSDYEARHNSHNLFSLVLDKAGYIHVTGDMQNGPNEPPTDPKDKDYRPYPDEFRYPEKYSSAKILYWRSNKPEDIHGGFEFLGKNDERKIPAYSSNGIRFFKDNNGEIFSSAAVKAIKSGNIAGSRGIGLYRYHVDTQKWETIGAPMPGDSHPVFFSELGSEGNEWFNGYFHSFMFDAVNRLHFATPVATTVKRKDYDRIIYAYSDDLGSTWKRTNNSSIGGFPLRGADSETNQGDVVGSKSDTYNWQVKLVPDKDGRPGIRAKKYKEDKNVWWAYDGSNWTLDNGVNNQKDVPHTGNTGPGGTMILHRNESPLKMQCLTRFSEDPQTYRLDEKKKVLEGYNKLLYVDEYALRTTGSAYGIASSQEKGVQSLVRIAYEVQGTKAQDTNPEGTVSGSAKPEEVMPEPIKVTGIKRRPVLTNGACYWLSDDGRGWWWLPAEIGGLYQGGGEAECRALDSCDGGAGLSGGGCYMWSNTHDL